MLSLQQRVFLKEKVMELEQALFFNMSQSILKFPTSVVNALHVNNDGQVWFMVRRSTQSLDGFDSEFGARLEFYKKGKSFFLHVTGTATMVKETGEIENTPHLSPEIRREVSTNMLLIKLQVSSFQYYPHRVRQIGMIRDSPRISLHPLTLIKTLQYIVKDIIPVFQSH